MRNKKLVWAAAGMAMVLGAGCSQEKLRPDFRNSTANNTAVQAVNPDAAAQAQTASTVDGQKAEKALERYRADKPEATRGKLLSELGN